MAIERWLALMACVAIGACGGSRAGSSADALSDSREGLYEFSASIPTRQPGTTQKVQGTLTVLGDSTFVDSPNNCVSEPPNALANPRDGATSENFLRYNCAGARIAFDRRNPAAARWFSTVPVPKQRNACVEYVRRETRQICVRYRPETYYTYEERSGAVQVRRIP